MGAADSAVGAADSAVGAADSAAGAADSAVRRLLSKGTLLISCRSKVVQGTEYCQLNYPKSALHHSVNATAI